MALTTHPHLAPKLKKEYSHTSPPNRASLTLSRMNYPYAVVEEWTKVTDEGRVTDNFVSEVGKGVTLLERPKATTVCPTDNNAEIKLFEWRKNKDG